MDGTYFYLLTITDYGKIKFSCSPQYVISLVYLIKVFTEINLLAEHDVKVLIPCIMNK